MPVFDAWADYYDLLHPGLPGEAEFYVGNAVKRGGPVLELGCGTGRLALPMALSGLQVVGLDDSASMLRLCRARRRAVSPLPGALRLARADMRHFRMRRRFSLVYMAYRTFMHCLSIDDQLACLQCVRRHLLPGSDFFCNLWAAWPDTIAGLPLTDQADHRVSLDPVVIPGTGNRLFPTYGLWRENERQWIHETYHLEEKAPDGAVLWSDVLTMTRAWITPREMEHLLCRAGLEPVAVLGSFDGAPLHANHTEMVWHARRPN